MTREEALKWFKDRKKMNLDDKCQQAEDMAIKVLEQEPCEDCISRAEAIKALGYDLSIEADGGFDGYRTVIKKLLNAIYNTQKKAIENLPSVNPQPKTGHWILLDECSNSGYYCSECQKKVVKVGWSDTIKKIKFCPNCSAKMEG